MYRVKCKTCLELFESIAPTKNQECPACKDKIYQDALKVCKGLCLYCGKEIPVSRLQKGRVTCNNLSCCVKYTHSKRDEDSKREINSKISNSVKNTFANKSPEEKEQYSRKMSIINKEIGSKDFYLFHSFRVLYSFPSSYLLRYIDGRIHNLFY